MNPKKFLVLAALALTAGVQAYTPFLQYPERKLKYPKRAIGWEDGLVEHYEAWKKRFVENGLVKGTNPQGQPRSISEGQSYGMMLALWFNDQAAFNTIWKTTEDGFWRAAKGTGGWYAWLNSGDDNFAGDADQDIAGMLIFASALVDSGYWTDYSVSVGGTAYNYKAKAKVVVNSVWHNMVDTTNGHQIQSWPSAGTGKRNPSYHMPQWYPVFKEFSAKNGLPVRNWDAVKTASFTLMNAQPGAAKGMARNFSTSTGAAPSGGTSSPNNYDMGFDAIRVPYRMGMSAMWYKDASAMAWCKNVWNNGFVDPAKPGMYTVAGPSLYGWGTAPKYEDAKYEKPMTNTMWGTAAIAVADSLAKAAEATSTIVSYVNGTAGLNTRNYFSEYDVTDSSALTAPNRNYYAQTLALIGAVAMAGKSWNVWDDLQNKWTIPDTSAKLTSFKTSKTSAVYAADSTLFTMALSKVARCTLTVVGNTSGAKYVKPIGDSSAATVKWKFGQKSSITGTAFASAGETVTATLRWSGMPATVTGNTLTLTILPAVSNGISASSGSDARLMRLADGSLLVGQPWFESAGPVTVRLRNAAGVVLHSSTLESQDGLVRVPSLSLAPGWYAVESQAQGMRATQSFVLNR